MRRLPTIEPAPLASVTPTSAEALRACPLRAAFDASREHRAMVLRGPAARLGTVCHEVLEAAAKGHFDGVDAGQLANAFEHLWCCLIDREQEAALQSPLERHFGPAGRWPYYTLKKAYLYQMVKVLVATRTTAHASYRAQTTIKEQEQADREYIGFGGKLRGRADHVVERDGRVEIEDYKSGAIFEEADSGTPEIKAGYQRQLLLYAALHWDDTGEWPDVAHVIALQGERFSTPIKPEEAKHLVGETLALLDAYNLQVEKGASVNELATPSVQACRHCPYKLVCDPFWDAVSRSWDLGGAAYIEGVIVAIEDFGASGRALVIDATRSNLSPGRYRLRGLTSSRFPELTEMAPGTKVRVIGAGIVKQNETMDLLVGHYTQLWGEESAHP
jgi:RecB family exonuclease